MTTQQMLDERYGRRTSGARRRGGWIAFGLVAVLALGYLAWATVSSAMNSVDVDVTGFTLTDEHSVTLTFQVTASEGTAVACALEAQDVEHGIVGWKVVEYPPLTAHAQAFSASIPTVAEATTGLVSLCWMR